MNGKLQNRKTKSISVSLFGQNSKTYNFYNTAIIHSVRISNVSLNMLTSIILPILNNDHCQEPIQLRNYCVSGNLVTFQFIVRFWSIFVRIRGL